MDKLQNVGTHSCKATCLSWLAKHGAPLDDRKHLGFHMGSGDKMALLYSRDAAAKPLRTLDKCLADIRSGRFQPDNSRSGYFPGEHSDEVEIVDAPDDIIDTSDSEDSQDDEDAHVGHAATEQAVDHVVGKWNELASLDDIGLDADAPLFRNKFTRYIHIAADEGGSKFRCGRDINAKYIQLEEKPKFMSPQCSQCFRS